jgi:hypothetical protein
MRAMEVVALAEVQDGLLRLKSKARAVLRARARSLA